MSRIGVALAAALAIVALALALVLSSSPVAVLATNSVAANTTIAAANTKATACQGGERLPRGTDAIRMTIGAFTGPAVHVKVYAGRRLVASGTQGSAWSGQTVSVPIPTVARTIQPVRVCFSAILVRGESLLIDGSETPPAIAARSAEGEILPGRIQIAYLGAARSSWLARASSVAGHMALGRAWSGTWVVFFVLALMLTVATLTSRLALRELDE